MSNSVYNIKQISEISSLKIASFLIKIKKTFLFVKKLKKGKNLSQKIITFSYV